MNAQISQWKSTGTMWGRGGEPATAGADRAYYEHADGRICFRHASWGTHGTGVHGFRDYGDGIELDAAGNPTGRRIPAAEF